MRLLRVAKRGALAITLSVVILVAGVSVYLRIEQYRFRRQAERLLSDVRELELEGASAAQGKVVVRKWGFDEWRGPRNPCTEDECIYRFQLVPKAAKGHVFADPFVSGLMARPLEWLGLRLALVQAWVKIRGNAPTSVSFSVYTVGRGCNEQGRLDCTLIAYTDTRHQGGSWSAHDQPDVNLKHSLLHSDYLVGTFSALFNADTGGSPAVAIWAEFSPDANTADVSRLMQFDLSCLTRLRSCKERDLMPTVWAQSVEDIRESPKTLTCTPELSRRVAHLADVIAIVRPKTVELSPPRYPDRPSQLRDLEIVSVIKKPKYPRRLPGSYIDVEVENPEMMIAADARSTMRPGQEYVFLLQFGNDPNIGWITLYPCGTLTVNDANLAMAREAATEQIE